MIKTVLVVGASGYIGSHLVPELANNGYHVKATGRSLSLMQKRGWGNIHNIELIELDLSLKTDLTPILEGVDAVFFLVHGMAHGHDFIEYELDVARHFSFALKQSQIQRVIYRGVVPPDHGH